MLFRNHTTRTCQQETAGTLLILPFAAPSNDVHFLELLRQAFDSFNHCCLQSCSLF